MARMLLNGESRFLSVCDVNGLDVAKRSPATTSTLEAGQRLSSHRGQTGGTESRKVSTLSSLDVRDRVLIAIIADPTAPVYSFQARRPPTRMRRGATAATTSMPRQRLRSIARESATQRLGIRPGCLCWKIHLLHQITPSRPMALTKLVNLWPASRLDELMPWAWAAERSSNKLAA